MRSLKVVLLLSGITLWVPHASARTIMFTTPGSQTWTVPSDWTPNNEIDCGGGGGQGADPFGDSGNGANAGSGAGGAQWAQTLNISLSPGDVITINVATVNSPFGSADTASFACDNPSACHYNSPSLLVYAVNGDGGYVNPPGTHSSTPGLGGGNFNGTAGAPAVCPSDGIIACGFGTNIVNGQAGSQGMTFNAPYCPTVLAPGGGGGGSGAGPLGGGGGAGGTAVPSGGSCLAGTGGVGSSYGGGGGGNSAANPGQGGPPRSAGAQGYCRVVYPWPPQAQGRGQFINFKRELPWTNLKALAPLLPLSIPSLAQQPFIVPAPYAVRPASFDLKMILP